MKPIAVLAAIIAFAIAPASADLKDYQRRVGDLAALSGIFGELHHIRRTCEPRLEADVWRDRMKQLIDLEDPQADARERMVKAFNAGYARAQQRFPYCDGAARDYAATRAAEGDVIVERLTAPLYEALRESDERPEVSSPRFEERG
ncbi:MAG: TIGR02301 family protein [Parvularculaceae bacterium]